MKTPTSLPAELQKAYLLFVDELEKHVVFLAEIVQQLQTLDTNENLEPISSSRAEQLEKRFHRIKGGAGFLGLEEISQLADRGEQFFKTATKKEIAPQELSVELKTILHSLEELTVS